MNIDFGIVKKYFSDKGFGFVSHTFLTEHQTEVFFHIKNIKKSSFDLAEKLNNSESIDTICFWYETEHTTKGEQVRNVVKSEVIQSTEFDNLSNLFNKVEEIWNDLNSSVPFWLRQATVDLVGDEQAQEIYLERIALEKEHNKKKQQEQEASRKIIEEKYRKLIGKRKIQEKREIQEKIEKNEFDQLVAEMKTLGLTRSNQVSRYITDNHLGSKYKNISGILKMEQEGTTWQYEGGFSKKIYAMLCEELGLRNQGSKARAVSFTPFKDL